MYESFSGGGLRVKIGHHKIGACAEIGQNRIRGGWGVKKTQKTSDIIYVRSLRQSENAAVLSVSRGMHKFTASEDSFVGKWYCIFFMPF